MNMNINFNVGNYNIALDFLKKEEYDQCIKYLTQFISDNPLINYGPAYLWRGYSRYKLGEYEEADDDFKLSSQSIQSSGDKADKLRLLTFAGLNFSKLGGYTKAIKLLKSASQIDPSSELVNLELYKIATLIEDFEIAKFAFSNLKKFTSDFNKVIAIAEEMIYENNQLEAGISVCNDIIAYDPNNDICYFFRALANFELGNFYQSLQDIDKNLELHPANYGAHSLRGLIFRSNNDIDAANREFLKAYELGDENALSQIEK